MTSERSHAYGRLIKSIDDLAARLHIDEAQTLRYAADARFFGDPDAGAATRAAARLLADLVLRRDFVPETADRLREDLLACGALALAAA
jgi:hypothetical protein